jgi:hypothetical protein
MCQICRRTGPYHAPLNSARQLQPVPCFRVSPKGCTPKAALCFGPVFFRRATRRSYAFSSCALGRHTGTHALDLCHRDADRYLATSVLARTIWKFLNESSKRNRSHRRSRLRVAVPHVGRPTRAPPIVRVEHGKFAKRAQPAAGRPRTTIRLSRAANAAGSLGTSPSRIWA